MRQGPLAGRYPAVALMVMLALIPYLALTSALSPLTPIIAARLHMSLQEMGLSSGLANAGYAVGTILAVAFAHHLPQRRMLIVYASLLVTGSVLVAAAQDPGMYIVGHVLQGLCTSLLLIAAVPPLATGFSAAKLRVTAVIMNVCIFGAVALGPAVGGLQAQAHAWRPLFWVIVAVATGALILAMLTFEDAPAQDRDAPYGLLAIALAITGCFAAFFGASELLTHPFINGETIVPLLGGLAVILVLIVYQFRAKQPLLTVKMMLVSTMPVAGIVIALSAAAASVSVTALTGDALAGRYSPLHLGVLYLPEVGGAVLTAFAFGLLLPKRGLHFLPLVGMVFLAAGIAVFRIKVPSSQGLTLVGAGLTGIGLGGTVAPALFVAGFSLPAPSLMRVFAIVELLRGVAAFMVAPIFVHFASTVGGNLDAGVGIALWIGLGISLGGALIAVLLYVVGGARPQAADVELFLRGEKPGWYSPPLLARLRKSISPQIQSVPAQAAGVSSATQPAALVSAANGNGNGNGNGHGNGATTHGLVLFAYDGSALAAGAVEQAGRQLAVFPGSLDAGQAVDALVLCVWQANDVGFTPSGTMHFDAASATEVRKAAEETAADGASLAEHAGFHAQSLAIEGSPVWKGIVDAAQEHHASLIVLGSQHHNGLEGHLLGSVAAEVAAHSHAPVLIVPQPA